MRKGGRIGQIAEPRQCPGCLRSFTPKFKKRFQVHCSKSCAWRATKGPEFNKRIAVEGAAKNGNTQRGRGTGKSYIKYHSRHLHRVVAEQKLGRPLVRGEIVHHIDGNHRNNHPDNLAVMTQAEHMREHNIGVPGQPLPWKPWEYRGSKR